MRLVVADFNSLKVPMIQDPNTLMLYATLMVVAGVLGVKEKTLQNFATKFRHRLTGLNGPAQYSPNQGPPDLSSPNQGPKPFIQDGQVDFAVGEASLRDRLLSFTREHRKDFSLRQVKKNLIYLALPDMQFAASYYNILALL